MASSLAFQRIQRDVLRLCATIPPGRVCTYAELGAVIDVPARHVAYILSRLDTDTRMQYPLHRLVSPAGKLLGKADDAAQRLTREGLHVQDDAVQDFADKLFIPSAISAAVERTTRPAEHTRMRQASGASSPALSELRGLGPVSLQMLVGAGITTAAQLRKADLFKLYAKIKAQYPRTSINLLYALLGAVEDKDWREVARERRTEVLMRLEDMGLL